MCSSNQEEFFLKKTHKVKKMAHDYLLKINPKRWRSTECASANPTLPPRYDIVASNTSESINNMLENYRDDSWIKLLDGIADFWSTQSSKF